MVSEAKTQHDNDINQRGIIQPVINDNEDIYLYYERIVDDEIRFYRNEPGLRRLEPNVGHPNGFIISNPLQWWFEKKNKYPIISHLARKILFIPATSAPVERLFSNAGLTIANDRTSLLPENAANLIFLHDAWPVVDEILLNGR